MTVTKATQVTDVRGVLQDILVTQRWKVIHVNSVSVVVTLTCVTLGPVIIRLVPVYSASTTQLDLGVNVVWNGGTAMLWKPKTVTHVPVINVVPYPVVHQVNVFVSQMFLELTVTVVLRIPGVLSYVKVVYRVSVLRLL